MINPFVAALSYISSSISFVGGSGDDGRIPTEDGVLVLTRSNFKEALTRHELLMVKFYLPWCTHCRAFAPEYLKVGKLLAAQRSKVKLGQVDAEEEKTLVKEHKVFGFPTVRLFKEGQTLNYYGLKKAENIVAWVKKNCPDC